MKFELGKYYKHEAGRSIYIAGEAQTFKFGKIFIVEETDRTGHSLSVIDDESEDMHGRWVEIGKDEWMREFTSGARRIN